MRSAFQTFLILWILSFLVINNLGCKTEKFRNRKNKNCTDEKNFNEYDFIIKHFKTQLFQNLNIKSDKISTNSEIPPLRLIKTFNPIIEGRHNQSSIIRAKQIFRNGTETIFQFQIQGNIFLDVISVKADFFIPISETELSINEFLDKINIYSDQFLNIYSINARTENDWYILSFGIDSIFNQINDILKINIRIKDNNIIGKLILNRFTKYQSTRSARACHAQNSSGKYS